MRVLFVYTNIDGFHEDTYSFGLASLISLTIHAGHDVKVVVVHEKKDYVKVYDEFVDFNPNVIGFSSVSSQFLYAKEIAEQLKEINNDNVIVCGGVHPTIYPECVLETNALDAVFMGEAEQAFVEFLEKIDLGRSIYTNDNLAFNDKGFLVRNKCKQLVSNLDIFPHPDREYFPFIETVRATGFAPFHFSRGCPFPCTYCSNHAIAVAQGNKKSIARFPTPEYCISEIESTIEKFKEIKKIAIVDDIFGLNKRWRKNFLELYRKRIKVPFICLLRADVVNEDFIVDLSRAGCYRISFGVESGNEYIRNEVMDRDMDEGKIIMAFDLCRKHNIETNAINIIGVPGETEDMLWDTIKLNRKIRPTNSGVNVFYPYRGTLLGDKCFQEELVDINVFNNFSNERRETVLQYDEEWKEKLSYYYNNWDSLVYPDDIMRRIRRNLSKIKTLKSIYRYISRIIGVR